MKILIVEDTETNRALLTWILQDCGHEVIQARDGKVGVEMFKAHQPELVFMDVMMPVMDGVEATREIRNHLGNTHVPIIFLTALTDAESLANCLEVGGDDFISKPINEQVLKAKIQAHSRIKELNEQLSKQNEELTRLNQLTQQEHLIAERVFETAFQASLLDSKNTRHFVSPAANFNGDLLLIAVSPSGSLYGVVADFTGHGLPAAIGALPLSKIFFDAVAKGEAVSAIAKQLNSDLGKFLPDDIFAAAAIAELNAKANRLTLWMGGMPDAIMTDADGKLKQQYQSRHMPLGILEDDEFERDCYIIDVTHGDRLYLYTDGIPEAMSPIGNMYGERRLLSHFDGRTSDPFTNLIEDNIAFTGEKAQADDITLLELTCIPVEIAATRTTESRSNSHQIPWSFSTKLSASEIQSCSSPISKVLEVIGQHELIKDHSDYLFTILTELFSNALEHGILGLDSALKNDDDGYLEYYEQREQKLRELQQAEIVIDVGFQWDKTHAELAIRVKDSGCGFDFEHPIAVNDQASCGRGISLINSLCEEVRYSEGGTRVDLRYQIPL